MRALLIATALMILCGSCATASLIWPADAPYSAQVVGTSAGPGTNTWSYSVLNTSPNPAYTVWLMAIEVDDGTQVESVLSPMGWAADTSVPHFISWIYVTGELPAGSSKDGFSAVFDRDPVYQNWSAMFDNVENPGETPVDFGSVQTVPEPAGGMMLLSGLVSLVGLLRRNRG